MTMSYMLMDIIGRLMMLLQIHGILTLVSLISLSRTFDLYLKLQEHSKDTNEAISWLIIDWLIGSYS